MGWVSIHLQERETETCLKKGDGGLLQEKKMELGDVGLLQKKKMELA